MRYGILGPLEVTRTGEAVTPSTPQQRTVLALLLANAGSWVSLATIVDELWPARTPRSARVIVQVAVSKLRKVLPVNAIRTGPSGYLLTVDGVEFDQSEFVAEARRGRDLMAAGRLGPARDLLAAALGRWRGDALCDVACGPVLEAHARWLAELRLSTVDSRVRIDLAAGRCHDVIAELTVLLARDPGQEVLAGSLMVALHQAGRAAEAAGPHGAGQGGRRDGAAGERADGLDVRAVDQRAGQRRPFGGAAENEDSGSRAVVHGS